MFGVCGLGEHRWGVLGDIAGRQQRPHEVEMIAFELRGRRQNIVGLGGGFVAVGIERHHQLEFGKGGFETFAVGARQHRIAGDGDQRANLARTRCGDFFGQSHRRQLTAKIRQAPHP